jgi:hypothetical protein
MKNFVQFLEEQKNKVSFLNFPSSFRELDDDNLETVREDLEHLTNQDPEEHSIDDIHNHPSIKPQKLDGKQDDAISDYTSKSSESKLGGHASSGNINAYLRNRAGDSTQKIMHGHSKEKVEQAVRSLSSTFTKENTNRVPITTYGGVPKHIGEKLASSKAGDIHHMAGFTSTSTRKHVAHDFAQKYNDEAGHKKSKLSLFSKGPVHHVVVYHLNQHVGLSAANHSDHTLENEVILHHGAKVEYSHSDAPKKENGKLIQYHHVKVHSEHLPLEHYQQEYK